jgi:hypothetical protein
MIRCPAWRQFFCIMRNAILFSLALSNPPARCCDVSFPSTYLFSLFAPLLFLWYPLALVGTCLDFAAEDRRVTERNAALEKMSAGVENLWSDPRRRSVVVLLQDRAQHVGEAVDGCRRSLVTMHSVMLPRNPLPATFPLLLDTFRSSQRIHRLIELNLVAGANFALGWIRKWKPRLNYSSMSLSYPPGGASLRVYLESTLQPARRIIARLLQDDAAFFREFHYLDPLGVDDSDNPML